MGTRASFWVGDPRELDKREWLGCKAWDGHPENFPEFNMAKTEEEFRRTIKGLSEEKDFANPQGGWPYPWENNIFLTDFTYAFFDGCVWAASFYKGFIKITEMDEFYRQLNGYDDKSLKKKDIRKDWRGMIIEGKDTLPSNVPAPEKYNPEQPDSIIIMSIKK